MLEYIKGSLEEVTPTYAVIDIAGLGYVINISLNTFSKIDGQKTIKLFVHEAIREDAHVLYGFFDSKERSIFRLLISVSGIGANTARLMLSKLSPEEIELAIVNGNAALLQSTKGVGAKSAQRVIVDLKDKVGKSADNTDFFIDQNNTKREEALSALVMLGFQKNAVEKIMEKLLVQMRDAPVEEIIKQALKNL